MVQGIKRVFHLLHSPHSPCDRGCHSKERQLARLVWGTAYDNGLLRLMLRSVRYSTFPLTTPFALSALWKKPGTRLAPQKPTDSTDIAGPVLPQNEADGNGGRELVPALRFRWRKGTAKIRPVNGFKDGDFPAVLCGKILPGPRLVG